MTAGVDDPNQHDTALPIELPVTSALHQQAIQQERGIGDLGLSSNVTQPPVVTDTIADQLMRSLDMLHQDYEQTVAADRGAYNSSADAHKSRADESESDLDNDESSMHGYNVLGSNDGGSDDDDVDCPGTVCDETLASTTADETNHVAAAAAGAQAHAKDICDREAHECTAPESPDFEDFQTARPLESFANFDESNAAVPCPPPHLQTLVLTQSEVRTIKETMQQLNITPPNWAKQLSDENLQRMVKGLLEKGA